MKLKRTTVTRVSSEKHPKSNFHAGKLLSNPAKNKRGPRFFFFFFFRFFSLLSRYLARLSPGRGIDVLLTRIVGSRGQGPAKVSVFYESKLHNVEKSNRPRTATADVVN